MYCRRLPTGCSNTEVVLAAWPAGRSTVVVRIPLNLQQFKRKKEKEERKEYCILFENASILREAGWHFFLSSFTIFSYAFTSK